MARWTAFPYAGEYQFDARSVQRHWSRLHRGDAEPLPEDPRLLEGWALFHSGEFQKAMETGLQLGLSGLTLAHKSACIYATYLEKKEKTRLDLFLQVAERAGGTVVQVRRAIDIPVDCPLTRHRRLAEIEGHRMVIA